MKDGEPIKIKDIAKMAGVSAGTVDRVLHNRGRVSEENLKKVKSILEIVNYQPNMIARSLASKKQYRIAVIIPAFKTGEYWETVFMGILRAEAEFADYGVEIHKLIFNQYNSQSLKKVSEELFENPYDAVLMATLFSDLIINISHKLDEMNIPYNYIDSNIPDQHQLAYFGTRSFQGGAIGAKLMLYTIDKKADILIARMIHAGDQSSNQWNNREAGFMDYLKKSGYQGTVHHLDLHIGNPVHNFNALDYFFEREHNIKGGIVFNSSCHILANYLKIRDKNDLSVIGYDVIEENTKMLKENIISALIAQRPQQQGYEGIKSLSEYLILKKTPLKENYLPIDILFTENVDYYNNQ
jgi:LacI family transcriptional regulator